ncbi:hypothetical protein [Pseudofrankia sp. BMG5.37]|uniref:hypothetical protein n=1 Tax=Pseudofrankia sp. BMG5.37 TaxID=3050035 RepID=UPI002894A00E|nr:hypothetical protein [Pseudofrankia sp. BMG5.37]MDT3441764.1 hypothetical protein [Pseudofrankia sp. BMG5.37]
MTRTDEVRPVIDDHQERANLDDLESGMPTDLGWLDSVSRHPSGAVVYFRPFDQSDLTCRGYGHDGRITLVPCPHIESITDKLFGLPITCAHCGVSL